jgi:hypothetical protein
VNRDHGLGVAEVRLLGTPKPGHGAGKERAGAPVRDEDAAVRQALEQPAHAAETTGEATGLLGKPRPADNTFVDQADFPWRPLGALLVDEGLLAQAELESALAEQQRMGGLLGQILVRRGAVTGGALARVLARQHGVDLGSPGPGAEGASEHEADEPARSAPSPETSPWRALGRLLVDEGLLSPAALTEALTEQQEHPGRRLGEILVERGYLTGGALALALAEQHGLDLGLSEGLDDAVEAVVVPAVAGQPVYEVREVEHGRAAQEAAALYTSGNFLEAADFACEYVDREKPVVLEIHRRDGVERETVWTYSREQAEAAAAESTRLVDTFGFDPTLFGRRS